MNAWIILLFLLMGNRGSDCGCQRAQNSCNDNNDCGCGRERSRNNGGRNRDNDCGCDDSRFEPRFDSRPFRDNRETCGCEEKED